MLALFRTNQVAAAVFLLLYALLLQLPTLFVPAAFMPQWYGEVPAAVNDLDRWASANPITGRVIAVFLVVLQGIIANALVARHRMARGLTQLPGLVVVLAWALVPAFRQLDTTQPANVCWLLSLLSLAGVYNRNDSSVTLFNAGFWLGVASLFVPAYLLLIVVLVIGVGSIQRLTVRSTLQVLTGAGVAYFLTYVYHYWYYDGDWLFRHLGQFGVYALPPLPDHGWPGLVALAVLLLTAVAAYGPVVRLLNIEGKKQINILLWALLMAVPVVLLSAGAGWPALQTLVPPLGILLGLRLTQIEAARAEFFHLVIWTVALTQVLWWLLE